MISCPKEPLYRNQKIKDLADIVPHCMNYSCWKPRDGTIVMAHPNWLRCGKGRGIKAHDLGAYLCASCHKLLDEDSNVPKIDKEAMFFEASWWSTLWRLQNGYEVVK